MKSIIFTLLATLTLSWCSCSDEMPDGGDEGVDIVVNTVLSAGDISTKSIDVVEKTIQNSLVAAFREENSKWICKGFASSNDIATATALTLKAKVGKIRLLAVANANDQDAIKKLIDNAATKLPTFDELSQAIVSTTEFKSSSLIKVKDTTVNLSLIDTGIKLPVRLTQLSARVDVNFLVNNDVVDESWVFHMTGYEVSQINGSSSLIWNDNVAFCQNEEFSAQVVTGGANQTPNAGFSFYSFEKKTSSAPIEMIISGNLVDSKNNKTVQKKYRLSFNPTQENGKTVGIVHGYQYTVTGNIDVKTQQIEFTTAIQPWGNRETTVDIIKFAYLFVKDQKAIMINKAGLRIAFESSSIANVCDIVVSPNRQASPGVNDDVSITLSNPQNGEIVVNSPVPNNYVPRTISFKVKNNDNLEELVSIIQYPPLYIESYISNEDWNDSQGQNNKELYVLTTLVPNYSSVGMADDINFPSYSDEDARVNNSNYFGQASMGYPLVDQDGLTVNTESNNRLVSPKFMLASQWGIVSAGTYNQAQTVGQAVKNKKYDQSCSDYWESVKVDGKVIRYEDWRLPTRAELCMIDVLQNKKLCAVKKILEGYYYWSSDWTQAFRFMDPQLSNGNEFDPKVKGFWRCIRDVKE